MRRLSSKFLCILAAFVLLFSVAPAQAAPSDPDHARSTAAWLKAQLNDGLVEQFAGYPDYGLTLDIVLGLRAAGASPDEVEPILDAMAGLTGQYGLEIEGSITSGLVGKAMLAAHVSDYPVHDFHGVDLLAMAEDTVDESGRVDGGPYDNNNIFSQALVMMGLAQQGRLPESTVGFLVKQQCGAGYFRMYYNDEGTCDESGAGYDVDGTALALFALEAALEAGYEEAAGPLERGRDWLVAEQGSSGGFRGSRFTPSENSNSTGLAVAALREHDPAAAQRGAAWVASLVYDSGPDSGAVAYVASERTGWAEGEALTNARRAGAIRATPQAILAFAPANYAFLREQAPTPEPDPTDAPAPDPTTRRGPIRRSRGSAANCTTGCSSSSRTRPTTASPSTWCWACVRPARGPRTCGPSSKPWAASPTSTSSTTARSRPVSSARRWLRPT